MSTKLYVGNLSYDTTTDALEDLFRTVGLVLNATIILDRESNRSKGFGFVTMDSEVCAKEAIETLHDKELNGRKLKVTFAIGKPHESRRPSPQVDYR